MITSPAGRSAQREARLALIETQLTPDAGADRTGARSAGGAVRANGTPTEVVVWKDRCAAFDQGDAAAGG
jgi:hypothetical protein